MTYIAAGVAFLVVVAVVVGIVDAAQAAKWREIAEERRRRWEDRQATRVGGVGSESDDEDDD